MSNNKTKVYNELVKIVGKERASMDMEDIVPYGRDPLTRVSKLYNADYVVLPETTDEVQRIVKVANEYRVPVVPYGAGTARSVLASARTGGIEMVMRRMDKILKINEETMTATIEPGVTWSKLFYEAAKFGLRPFGLGGGPNTGTPVGCFMFGGGNTGGMDMNETVGIEVVLPSGELLRTGSAAYMGHEEINPYCRVAWGPNVTGIIRGSLGIYGIVTKLIRRLSPIREIEEHIQVGFDNLSNCIAGMKELVKLGICRQVVGIDGAQAAIIAAEPPEITTMPEKYAEFEDSLPAYLVMAGISCHNEAQAKVYRELIQEAGAKGYGTVVEFSGDTKRNLDELWGTSSTKSIRYLRHFHLDMDAVCVPPSMVPGVREITLKILDELDYHMVSFSGRVIKPRVWISPWERNENYYFEQNIEFDFDDPSSVEKFRIWTRRFNDEMDKYGGTRIYPSYIRHVEKQMNPSYIKLLRDIKHSVDPNGIGNPHQIFRDL